MFLFEQGTLHTDLTNARGFMPQLYSFILLPPLTLA